MLLLAERVLRRSGGLAPSEPLLMSSGRPASVRFSVCLIRGGIVPNGSAPPHQLKGPCPSVCLDVLWFCISHNELSGLGYLTHCPPDLLVYHGSETSSVSTKMLHA
ncbi:hypothetical protein L210DRAFT_3112917 [Boletus edulis BED1]|uniref:Uncharacterized protein n=1 Tax=Boletus edulis BED1 TaxID=1328754 RepID=A0AAD4BZU8_BOLED|nr:hypothetical protein L210DRAFT_3112917 [Boletus edulis BED1]